MSTIETEQLLQTRVTQTILLKTKRCLGFTLIEVLVVLVVLLVLCGLLISGFAKYRDYRTNLVCMANLRSIGIAIFQYAGDRQGLLPGPSLGGISARYRKSSLENPTSLSHYLVTYLNAPVSESNEWMLLQEFMCPATMPLLSGADHAEGKTYSQVPSRYMGLPNITKNGTKALYPFGYKWAGTDPDNWEEAIYLNSVERPEKTFAVLDRRNVAPGIDSGHLVFRNILFLDGHVRSVPLERFISFTEIRY